MWIASVLTFLWFDVEWGLLTTMRPLSDVLTYASALVAGTLLALPAAAWPRKPWIWAVLTVLIDLLLIANLMYCRTYNAAIPPANYALAGNLRDFGASVSDSVSPLDLGFFVILAAGLWAAKCRCNGQSRPTPYGYLAMLGTTLCVWGLTTLIIGCTPYANMQKMANSAYYHNSIPVAYTLFGRIYYDIASVPKPLTEAQRNEALAEVREHSDMLNRMNVDTTATRPVNLVYVIVESLESWPIGSKAEGKEITPNLNRLLSKENTLYVPHVLSQADAGRSIDGQLALMTGLTPMRGQVFSATVDIDTLGSLHREFSAHNQGLSTRLLTGDNPTTWNLTGVAEGMGVGKVLSRKYWKGEPTHINHTLYDKPFIEDVIRHIDSGDISLKSPYMIEVMTYSTHNPFVTHPDLKRLKLKGDYPPHIDDYMVAINATDHALGIFIDRLSREPDFDRTLIVITGDHEGLANYRKDAVKHPATRNLVSSEQFTPFIAVNSPVGGRIDKIVGQIDLYTTVLDLMGWTPTAAWRGMGMSAIDPRHPGCAIAPNGTVHGQGKAPDWMTAARDRSDRILRFNLMPQILL